MYWNSVSHILWCCCCLFNYSHCSVLVALSCGPVWNHLTIGCLRHAISMIVVDPVHRTNTNNWNSGALKSDLATIILRCLWYVIIMEPSKHCLVSSFFSAENIQNMVDLVGSLSPPLVEPPCDCRYCCEREMGQLIMEYWLARLGQPRHYFWLMDTVYLNNMQLYCPASWVEAAVGNPSTHRCTVLIAIGFGLCSTWLHSMA